MDSKDQSEGSEIKQDSTNTLSSLNYRAFFEGFSKEILPEEKLRKALDYMSSSISQEGTPLFKEFWEARKLCLPLFKENLNPVMRTQLWNEYMELSMEARRLKEIWDEKSSFNMEQIDLAVSALEKDLEDLELLRKNAAPVSFPKAPNVLSHRFDHYDFLQKQLNIFNTFASRINELRKEVLKTDMRVRFKNKFFKRLSSSGDLIFPKRKDLIKEVSEDFVQDVNGFVEKYFSKGEALGAPFYVLREDIKTLQNIAKTLTLNTHAFMKTREELSQCWDILKRFEKEHKKEKTLKKQEHDSNRIEVEAKIKIFAKNCEQNKELQDLQKEFDEIIRFMRSIYLKKEDIKELRKQIFDLKSEFIEKQKSHKESKKKEKGRDDRKKVEGIREKIFDLQKQAIDLDIDDLSKKYHSLIEILKSMEIDTSERKILHTLLAPINDAVESKKEDLLLIESNEIQTFKEILSKKKERRMKTKTELEGFRKALGGSGFNFEKAMFYREIIDLLKEHLDRTDKEILMVEDKISEFL